MLQIYFTSLMDEFYISPFCHVYLISFYLSLEEYVPWKDLFTIFGKCNNQALVLVRDL